MSKLHRLFDEQGQSPWLDNLNRDFLRDGTLARFVTEGIRGVTANPTMFAKAIEGSDATTSNSKHSSPTDARSATPTGTS